MANKPSNEIVDKNSIGTELRVISKGSGSAEYWSIVQPHKDPKKSGVAKVYTVGAASYVKRVWNKDHKNK